MLYKIKNSALIYSLCFFLIALFSVSSSNAQVSDKAKEYNKTAKRKTERAVDKKVERAIDDGLDALFGKKKKKKEEDEWDEYPDETIDSKEEFIDEEDILANEFIGSFTLNSETFINGNKSEEESNIARYAFQRHKTAIKSISMQNSPRIVFDLQNQTLTTLQEQGKTAIIMKRPPVKIKQVEDKDVKVTPLSGTKTIQGYSCKKYLIDKPDEIVTMWVAEEMYYNFRTMMLTAAGQGSNSSELAGSYYKDIYGIPLEMTIESKSEDRRVEMRINEISSGQVDNSIFDTTGYSVTDLTKF